ncbi:hypothetical protein PVL29_016547 [Vitis rotundifolia]|nr:hypothetical protein PVL29_016547 [Vitis rotundifolia]
MRNHVKYEEEFILNSRGLKLFTCRWFPANQDPKALIFILHGYAMECSIFMNDTGTRLAKAGYAVYGIDFEGHGKSSGLGGLISCFDDVVSDCSNYFSTICEHKDNIGKMRYLYGESMGGAIALNLDRQTPDYWDGAVLVAPMCKIADDMRPNPVVITVLTMLCKVIPTWKMIPVEDVVEMAFKEPEKRAEIRSNPYCYKGRIRLKTGQELLRVSLDLEKNLHKIQMPFLVVHGGDDKVTDPSTSKQLHETAASSDKTFKLYPGMWHGLTSGEPLENIDTVFSDIINWLDARSAIGNSRLEKERKSGNDGFISSKNMVC